jgi:hypothetical protein
MQIELSTEGGGHHQWVETGGITSGQGHETREKVSDFDGSLNVIVFKNKGNSECRFGLSLRSSGNTSEAASRFALHDRFSVEISSREAGHFFLVSAVYGLEAAQEAKKKSP